MSEVQGKNRETWIQRRVDELFQMPYFHVVFSLPDVINGLALQHPKIVYDSLFVCAWCTVKTFGKDQTHRGAQTGMRQACLPVTEGFKHPEFPAQLILPIFLTTPANLNSTFLGV